MLPVRTVSSLSSSSLFRGLQPCSPLLSLVSPVPPSLAFMPRSFSIPVSRLISIPLSRSFSIPVSRLFSSSALHCRPSPGHNCMMSPGRCFFSTKKPVKTLNDVVEAIVDMKKETKQGLDGVNQKLDGVNQKLEGFIENDSFSLEDEVTECVRAYLDVSKSNVKMRHPVVELVPVTKKDGSISLEEVSLGELDSLLDLGNGEFAIVEVKAKVNIGAFLQLKSNIALFRKNQAPAQVVVRGFLGGAYFDPKQEAALKEVAWEHGFSLVELSGDRFRVVESVGGSASGECHVTKDKKEASG